MLFFFFLFKIIIISTIIFFSLVPIILSQHSIHTDKSALLSFKKGVLSDPYSTLSNWNEQNNVCNFTNVKCGNLHHRVVHINLNDSSLTGVLSSFLANLTQLRYLYLVNNHFSGIIPPEFSSLYNLIEIKLSSNNLHGQIPGALSLVSNLRLIFLNDNFFNGEIPPSFFSNCTKLKNVDFSDNQLTGIIPSEIGKCPNLWNLNLYNNQFFGEIPISLGNATDLRSLDVENNTFSGELPSKMLSKFPEMIFLHLSDNNMVSHDNNSNLDPFFTALSNCTKLVELQLTGNGLGGSLPSSIGGLSRDLVEMQLQDNRISGEIPAELGQLSSLSLLNLTSNLFTGTFCDEIGHLIYLEQLSLSFNFFTGIPSSIGKLWSSLGLVDISHNNLSGRIPDEIGKLINLNFLFLNNNLLSGTIPPSLGSCTSLQTLDLSYNMLTGRVPPEISGLHEMRRFINLSHNHFEGLLPIELSKLSYVEEIDLSSNKFNGSLFSQISSCYELKLLNLSHNSLQGLLVDSLGDLKSLVIFDVSKNNLSGIIPPSMSKISTLKFINLSLNDFSGAIPSGGIFDIVTSSSFIGNKRLCGGGVLGIPHCRRKKRGYFKSITFLVVFCIIIFVSGFFATICCVMGYQRLIASSKFVEKEGKQQQTPRGLTRNFPRITHKELSEATGGFNEDRLVGSGSYGHVYRGTLPDGTIIAVKVLHLQTGNSTKSFIRECQVLKTIRHRNLIRIITACSLPDFKALVLPYMANGSLDRCLYSNALGQRLDLLQRVNICSDIAEGMAYLHHHSPIKVIHCDLKPSNVLLNDDMTALVSDFGIARLVAVGGGNGAGVIENMGNSTANKLSGSIGYIAPEYGYGSNSSTNGDVYSFGVLVLEMVTRKRPTDDMFGEDLSLHKYVKNHFRGQTESVVDRTLVRALRDQSNEVKRMWEVGIGELLELGLLCTQETPSMRPTMLDCADDLDRLKRYLNGDNTATFASSLGISSSTYSYD